MIEVKVFHDGSEIARMHFTKVAIKSESVADYVAEIGVERLGPEQAVGIRRINLENFNRLRYNVLGLIQAALDELEWKDLTLDQPTGTSDLARGQRRVVSALQAWAGRLHHH